MKPVVALVVALGLVACSPPPARERAGGPSGQPPQVETVFEFHGSMPTGVTVSKGGRIFVNYPRWGDDVPFSVAELKDGKEVPYPDPEANKLDTTDPGRHFLSVQSVVVDAKDRLWVLDPADVAGAPVPEGGPKLVQIDLATDRIVRTIVFPPDVAGPRSFVNDVRFDLAKGPEGTAYITDTSFTGPNGIVVVDLATGHAFRRLDDHPSTKPEPGFDPVVEGKPLLNAGKLPTAGSDGIALSPDGARLYYCSLIGRELWSVDAGTLADPSKSEADVEATLRDEGLKGVSDGLETDSLGRVYGGDLEHNSIVRRDQDGVWRALVHDDRMVWPDTLSIGYDGKLYVTANQLDRQASFQNGADRRQKPYLLLRVPIGAGPARR
ncbi:L-dopachrome tautomerase-related protein [Segniliparus sp.]|uniref:L-dopachrome tautomerase-related protein n=1 Tax=Segniliparus sp. TaxID=2804064 RepID=UPI003F66D5A0